jgi:hypothetical protein
VSGEAAAMAEIETVILSGGLALLGVGVGGTLEWARDHRARRDRSREQQFAVFSDFAGAIAKYRRAELHGELVAAVSLADNRAIADPFSPTAHLVATMRVRAQGLHAVEHMPSLRDRLLAGLPTSYRARLAGSGA